MEQKQHIINTIGIDINPILVFWDSAKKWTVLGSKAICSYHGEELSIVNLDDIHKKISIWDANEPNVGSIKTEANMLLLEKVNKIIWVPAGAELFGLMNILLMFPLNK